MRRSSLVFVLIFGALMPSEVYHEIRLVPGATLDIRRSLLTFRDYQDLVLYDISFGYYSHGRVDFRP